MKPLRSRLAAAVFVITGLVLLANVAVPVSRPLLRSWFGPPELIDPSQVSGNPNIYVVNVLGVSNNSSSYSPQTWFDLSKTAFPTPIPTSIKYFTLSIPRLGIDNITVEINGTDLQKNAIHFPGTVLPGSYGNTVVFGHSSLPQFYTPQNPVTIFNPLLDAEVGDEILVNYDGVAYRYLVKDTAEVDPGSVEVLSQSYDKYELTLITCTPLGTYWRRFVVRAELTTE